jgi:hypothetical protein
MGIKGSGMIPTFGSASFGDATAGFALLTACSPTGSGVASNGGEIQQIIRGIARRKVFMIGGIFGIDAFELRYDRYNARADSDHSGS